MCHACLMCVCYILPDCFRQFSCRADRRLPFFFFKSRKIAGVVLRFPNHWGCGGLRSFLLYWLLDKMLYEKQSYILAHLRKALWNVRVHSNVYSSRLLGYFHSHVLMNKRLSAMELTMLGHGTTDGSLIFIIISSGTPWKFCHVPSLIVKYISLQ